MPAETSCSRFGSGRRTQKEVESKFRKNNCKSEKRGLKEKRGKGRKGTRTITGVPGGKEGPDIKGSKGTKEERKRGRKETFRSSPGGCREQRESA